MSGRIAFFDVDETLLADKSMLSFWHFWSAWPSGTGRPPVTRPSTGGADRETLNRAYFALFAGAYRSSLEAAARQWYARYRGGPQAYLSETLRALRDHQREGDEVVLVTGSGAALVQPVADDLGVRHVLATEQLADAAGVLTGEVRRPMIGAAKAEAAAGLIGSLGARARDCWAYGDHATDLAMLSLVGRPVVVGEDPVLAAHGTGRGWRFLSARTGPRFDRGAVRRECGAPVS
ncbi:HAD-IB family hydrolase [Streptomyces sp. NPDC046862]|uniref:HAD family hydrolase n=1 Tax=Streptomyces sp. NPDC046862 TaxID=3154603 RepID=UPI003452475A